MLKNCCAPTNRCVTPREGVRAAVGLTRDVSRLCVRARAFNGAEYEHTDGSASLAPLQPSQGGVQQLQEHKAAPELQWNEGHLWSVTVEVPAAQVLEYKYVVMQPDGLTALHWQSGNNAVLALMPDDEQIEIFDNWYDPASSTVAPNGRPRTTRSDRLALWANQMSGSVGQLRGELRATRMSVFEAQQGMKEALEQVKHTQDCLSEQVEENQKMAEQVLTMQEKNRKMRLQLIESQTLFKEVMAEARSIILSTVESSDETDDELMQLSDMGFGSPRITAEAEDTSRHMDDDTASESEYEYEDEESDEEEFYDVDAEAEYQDEVEYEDDEEEESEAEASEEEEEEQEEDIYQDEAAWSEEDQEPVPSHQPYERTRRESTAQLAQHDPEPIRGRDPEAQPQQRQPQAQPQSHAVDDVGADVPAPVVTPARSSVPQSRPAHKTAFPGGHMTPKNGYAPRRTSRRSPVTMVDMPKPSDSTPVVATAAAAVAAATSSNSLRDSDTARYGPYESEAVDTDEDAAEQVDASSTAASLKKMLHTKAVPATEAAGALLEAQVKLEAGLDGASNSEDLEWLTDQAESLLSVFEQLEDDVYEAQQAVGRVISEA